MISFFIDGTWVHGADYSYTPEHKETRIAKENVKRIEIDKETKEETVVYEDVEREIEVTVPAKGREDCIFVLDQDLPANTIPVLTEDNGTFTVEFVEKIQEEI